MKIFRTTSGPFAERPHYTEEEVDQICIDELRKVELMPQNPEPIRIDRFIEKRFKINPDYGDLDEGVLGYTKFGPQGVEEMVVSRFLVEEDNKISERRVNTTFAHEAGHGLLHAHLFVLGQARSLFEGGLDKHEPKILCRNNAVMGVSEDKKNYYDGRWWEYQANMAIGSLLLPKNLVRVVLEPFMTETGRLGAKTLGLNEKEKSIHKLVEIFDINPVVARIRIDNLYSKISELQPTL